MKSIQNDSPDVLQICLEAQTEGLRLVPSPADRWEKFKDLQPHLQEERFLFALDLLWKGMWDEPHDPADWDSVLDPWYTGTFPDPFAG